MYQVVGDCTQSLPAKFSSEIQKHKRNTAGIASSPQVWLFCISTGKGAIANPAKRCRKMNLNLHLWRNTLCWGKQTTPPPSLLQEFIQRAALNTSSYPVYSPHCCQGTGCMRETQFSWHMLNFLLYRAQLFRED